MDPDQCEGFTLVTDPKTVKAMEAVIIPNEAGGLSSFEDVVAGRNLNDGTYKKFVYQGKPESKPMVDFTGLPPFSMYNQDLHIPIPPDRDSAYHWSQTILELPKYADEMYSYEQCVRLSLAGDPDMTTYWNFIMGKFGKGYLARGNVAQAEDLAGLLLRFRYTVPKNTKPKWVRKTVGDKAVCW